MREEASNVPAVRSSRAPRYVCPECDWCQAAPGRCRTHLDEALLDTRKDAVKAFLHDRDDARVRRSALRRTFVYATGGFVAVEGGLWWLATSLLDASPGAASVIITVMLYVVPVTVLVASRAFANRLAQGERLHWPWTSLPDEEAPTPGERKPTGRRGAAKVLDRGAEYGWRGR